MENVLSFFFQMNATFGTLYTEIIVTRTVTRWTDERTDGGRISISCALLTWSSRATEFEKERLKFNSAVNVKIENLGNGLSYSEAE